jgi:hypothetical protein
MAKTQTRRCRRCDRKYDVLQHTDGDFPLDGPRLGCPDCGTRTYRVQYGVPKLALAKPEGVGGLPRAPLCGERGLEDRHFPYFDHGLGVMLHSKDHREWCMKHDPVTGQKREEALVCVGDMEWDPIAIVDEQISTSLEIDRKFAAYKDEMLSQPDTRKVWHQVELLNEQRDYSLWGVETPEAALNHPPEGEVIKQDLEGHLYTDSGWSTKTPQAPVPTALYAAGYDVTGLPAPKPVHLLDVIDAR